MIRAIHGVALVLTASIALSSGAAAWEVRQQEGVVVSAGMNKLVMSDGEAKQHSHAVDELTKITLHGKPARLEQLKLGMRIRVTLDENNKLLAIETVDETKADRMAAAIPSADVPYSVLSGASSPGARAGAVSSWTGTRI